MKRRALRTALASLAVVAAVNGLAFAAFLAWRIPNEREENRAFEALVRRDDGPHATWLDDGTVEIDEYLFERSRGTYRVRATVLPCTQASALAASIDPNAALDCEPPPFEPPPSSATAPVVAAISDVHGHYRHLAALLEHAGVVDRGLDWAFGANHLVIAGDVVDKGPEITRALWLIKKLERQAARAGGHVHFLLGNHEYYALTGSSRINDRKYIELTTALGIPYARLFSTATELGRWIRRHGVAVRVNDTLFVHAGLSPAVVSAGPSVDDLNRIARETLDPAPVRPASGADGLGRELVWGRDGVTAFRGYFDRSFPFGFWRTLGRDPRENPAAAGLLAETLSLYGVRRVVAGHTETRRIVSLHGGRLVTVAQRMPPTDAVDMRSPTEILLIEGPRLTCVAVNGARRPLRTSPDLPDP